jgi:C4-dicarboxylate-specific signal transduction histidine kinase
LLGVAGRPRALHSRGYFHAGRMVLRTRLEGPASAVRSKPSALTWRSAWPRPARPPTWAPSRAWRRYRSRRNPNAADPAWQAAGLPADTAALVAIGAALSPQERDAVGQVLHCVERLGDELEQRVARREADLGQLRPAGSYFHGAVTFR